MFIRFIRGIIVLSILTLLIYCVIDKAIHAPRESRSHMPSLLKLKRELRALLE